MKVVLIGDFSENYDEGLKNVAKQLFIGISQYKNIQVNVENLVEKNIVKLIYDILYFKPDIIHYIPGPTNKSFMFLTLLKKLLNKNTKYVLSATYPMYNFYFLKIIGFRPDLYISSSSIQIKNISKLNIKTLFLLNGVDTKKFYPTSESNKRILREKYGLKQDHFTFLHVGHIIPNRNLLKIKNLAKDNQVIIISSSYISSDKKIYSNLIEAGCIIFSDYYKNIEEFYQCADCYIFPVKPDKSINCPLSILEAMASNLPIITTKFEGLDFFKDKCKDIYFIDNSDDFENIANQIKKRGKKCSTREFISEFTWNKIICKIVDEYKIL